MISALALVAAALCFPCVLTLPPAPAIDLEDETAVFRHVFANLPPHAVVYPSENHLYFEFSTRAGRVRGNLWIDVFARRKGILPLFYALPRSGEVRRSWSKDLGPPLLTLIRKDDFLYQATFESRTVVFELHRLKVQPPSHVILRAGESYVGPAFDESGLQFALVFCRQYRHFLWILNQDEPLPDTLLPHGSDLLVGRKSKFAFYRDSPWNRLILIGVSAAEAALNSPFDGPFDQLPDNHILSGEVDLLSPLKRMSGDRDLDKYGRSKTSPDIRTSIAPYLDYEKLGDLSFVARCRRDYSAKPDLFYACLAGFEP